MKYELNYKLGNEFNDNFCALNLLQCVHSVELVVCGNIGGND